MRRSWPILFLGLALAASLIWGYTQHRQRRQLALRAENFYQQAFHQLENAVLNMEDALARLLVTRNPAMQRDLLADLRVFSGAAVESLSGLPLLTVSLERTNFFLDQVRDTAERHGFILNHGGQLSAGQWNELRRLYDQARVFKQEITNLAPTVAHGNIRWFQTERATHYSADGSAQTPFLQAVTKLDGKLQPPGTQGAEDAPPPLQRPKGDLGPRVDVNTAAERAGRFLDLPPAATPRLDREIGDPFPLYVFTATKQNNVPVTIGVSQNGGHVIWMLDGREVREATLNRDQAVERARQFLAKNGLTGFREMFYDEYGDAGAVAVVTLVPVRDGLTFFNEWVKVRLARDNGEILGYDATQYWVNRHDRPPRTPRLTPQEAAARVNPRVQVRSVDLGVIDVFRGQEALVYKVRAELDGEQFDVYIDAVTGQEERVERVEREGDAAGR